jgi:deferrochelatase/peroxidase EfeB
MAEQKYDVNEPSRRRLLKGIGALGGALAISGGCPVAHAAKDNSSPGTLSPDARMEAQPFYGPSGRRADAAAGVDDACRL